jgi:hypothetical protein
MEDHILITELGVLMLMPDVLCPSGLRCFTLVGSNN